MLRIKLVAFTLRDYHDKENFTGHSPEITILLKTLEQRATHPEVRQKEKTKVKNGWDGAGGNPMHSRPPMSPAPNSRYDEGECPLFHSLS